MEISAVAAWVGAGTVFGVLLGTVAGPLAARSSLRFDASTEPGEPADEPTRVVVLGVDAPAGVAVGWWQGRDADSPPLSLTRALVGGGVAGLAGGAVFGIWLRRVGVLPQIAGLVGADSVLVGGVVHFAIAATIGITFAVLFQRDVRGYGSALGWGLAYGVLWWMLEAGTLFPLLGGRAVEWSTAALSARLGSLVGHLAFGLLLGVVYGLVWGIVGPLTLLPTFLGRPLVWDAAAIEPTLPLLFGHLVYGVVTGLSFSVLERHRRKWATVNPRIAEHESERRRPLGTSAPAAVLVAMTLIPILVLLL